MTGYYTNYSIGGGQTCPTIFAGMSHQWGSRWEFLATGIIQSVQSASAATTPPYQPLAMGGVQSGVARQWIQGTECGHSEERR